MHLATINLVNGFSYIDLSSLMRWTCVCVCACVCACVRACVPVCSGLSPPPSPCPLSPLSTLGEGMAGERERKEGNHLQQTIHFCPGMANVYLLLSVQ